MGLKMKIYWIVTYIFGYAIYFVSFLVVWMMGAVLGENLYLLITGLNYWKINSPGAIFLLFFIWGHTVVAFAFLFSVFLNKTRTATIVGYIWVFATGLLANQVITQYLQSPDTPAY
jgi:hypothetical protein